MTPAERRGFRLRLRQAMQAMTNRELARRIKVSPSIIGDILVKGAMPRTETLADIAEALEVSLDWLVLNRGDQMPARKGKTSTDGALQALEEAESAVRALKAKWR